MTAAPCLAATGTDPGAPRGGGAGARAAEAGGHRSRLDAWGAALELRGIEQVLLLVLCFVAVVPILYMARAADGSAFTSWRWTFSGARMVRVTAALAPALLAAAAAARLSLRARRPAWLAAALAGVAILPLWAEPEVVLDAARYFVQAKALEVEGLGPFLRAWGRDLDAWTDLPLVPLLYGLAFSIAGAARPVAQALDTILFAATALLTARLGRALWDEEAGVDAALLLLGVPFLLVQVPLLLVDVPAMFFLALFAWSFLAVVREGGALRVAGCAAAASAAALSKYSLWPMLLLLAAAAISGAGPGRRRVLARSLGVAALAGLALGAVAAARPDVLARQAALLAGFQAPGLARWREGFASAFLFQSHPFLTGLAVLGAARAALARDRRFLVAGAGLAAALAIGSVRARYAVPLLPFVALAAAHGLAAARDATARRTVALCVATASLVVAYGAYLPFLRGTSLANLASAGRHLDALEAPVVEVRAVPQRRSSGSTAAAIPLLAYATRKAIACPDPWPGRDDAAARASPLRFTWELRRPPFCAAAAAPGAPVVVISGEPAGAPPGPGLEERARFAATSDAFTYQTLVTVYGRDPGT